MSTRQHIELTVINERPATTSRKIAKYFNKQHKVVLRKIENLDCSPQFTGHNFVPSEYKDPSGKTCKEYIIYRDGFAFLAMGFTGKLAGEYKEAYIYAFNEMEHQLKKPLQTPPQQAELTLNDILTAGRALEKTQVEIIHTKQGEVINVTQLEQQTTPEIIHDRSTTPTTIANKSPWIRIVETLFDVMDKEVLPEKMRQNMLITKEMITLPTGKREKHSCLFFRASNMMAFFRESPRFFELINASNIYSTQTLLTQFQQAGVLAFDGKIKEKGIPIDPNDPSTSRRVSHLVAIDLMMLEQNYGLVITNSKGIAETLR